MSIFKNGIVEIYTNSCIKVYDPEKKELIAIYKTYGKAGNKLGVSSSAVQHKCESKNRLFSPFLQKNVAVRLSTIKDEDLELIAKTDKSLPLNFKK